MADRRARTGRPVFRAEPHDTARHLAEYTSLDAELGFIRDHFDVIAVARDVIAGMVDAVREQAAPAVELLGVQLPAVPAEIPCVDFADTGVDDVDLAPVDERRLCEQHGEWNLIRRIGVQSEAIRERVVAQLSGAEHQPPVVVRRDWYF